MNPGMPGVIGTPSPGVAPAGGAVGASGGSAMRSGRRAPPLAADAAACACGSCQCAAAAAPAAPAAAAALACTRASALVRMDGTSSESPSMAAAPRRADSMADGAGEANAAVYCAGSVGMPCTGP